MSKYRHLPVVIEAFRMTKERRWDHSEWPNWLHLAWNREPSEGAMWCDLGGEQLYCGTLEGVHIVTLGDWIIQGVEGEIYPCKHEIFMKTYEPHWEYNMSNVSIWHGKNPPIPLNPTWRPSPQGCVCPPTSDETCKSPTCPRKPWGTTTSDSDTIT